MQPMIGQEKTEDALREQMEDALQKSEQRYRAIFENTKNGVAVYQPVDDGQDFVFKDFNSAAERFERVRKEDLIGKRLLDVFPNADKFGVFASLQRVYQTGKPEHLPACYYKDEQREGWRENFIYRLPNGEIVAIYDDITELKRAEDALRESEQKFRRITKNSSDALWQLTPDLVFTEIVHSGKKLLGYEPHELLGRPIWEFLAPNGIEPMRRRMAERIKLLLSDREGFVPEPYEIENVRPDGVTVWTEAIISPVFNNEGNLIAFEGVSRDISERKRLEEERLEVERKVLHAQKLESLGVMAGGIAHDFNNQLAIVLGNLELALMEKPPEYEAKVKASIMNAVQAAKRSAELSRQIQIYTGNTFYYPVELDLNELLNKNPIPLNLRVSKHVSLNLELNNTLPPVKGDPDQIQCLVTNLLVNASEAIGDKDGEVTLATGVMDCDKAYLSRSGLEEKPEPGRFIFIQVTDTGCGMDADTQRKLFDPFFSTKFWGRGLGMSKVMGITKGHQGAIIVDTEIGKGTTIRVLFRSSEEVQETNVHVMDVVESKAPVPDSVTRRKTILVVEDEEMVRDLVVKRLELLGYDAITATDGEEGVSVFRDRSNEIDLVMLDFKMPKMDGVEAFGELIRIKPDVKVILSSGYTEDVVIQSFPGPRPASILHKPYDMEALKARLERLLGTAG
ncbi:MAG: PAS domain S-box protein [Deltaproteobacteria bacterium]|nr:PAS domain S-box protein [Deltaproteobacteria bacterium]